MAVAVLNIEIPQVLGSVINVVAKFARDGSSTLFTQQVKLPVLRLIYMYVAQVRSETHLNCAEMFFLVEMPHIVQTGVS